MTDMAVRIKTLFLSKVHRSMPTLRENRCLTALEAALWLAAVASFVLYLHYSFQVYPMVNFNSDDAAALLYSSEVIKQHALLPAWYSSTGFAWPLNKPESLLLPLFLTFSNDWMTSFRVSVAIDQLLMWVLIWWVLGRAGLSRTLRLAIFCVLFASLSYGMAEQTVMIGVQIWFYAKMLLISFLVFQCAVAATAVMNRKVWMWFVSLFLAGAWLFVDRSYMSRMLPPLCVALVTMWILRKNWYSTKAVLSVAGVLALAIIAAEFVSRYLIPETNVYQLYSSKFVDLNVAGANFLLLLRGLMELFGAMPPVGVNVYSVASFFWGVKLVILCVAFLGPLWLLTQWRYLKSEFLRFLVIVFIASLGMRVLVYVFTGISVGSVNTNRYFISVAFLGMTIMSLYFEHHWRVLPVRAGALAMSAVLMAASPLVVAKPAVSSTYEKLAQYLESEHLRLGYSTFWNAGVVTALSDDRVRIRQVILGNGIVNPYRWLSSPNWYEGDAGARRSFLLLKGAERAFNTGFLTPALGKPTRILNFGDYRVLVFPFDLAWRLGWKYGVDEKLLPKERRVVMDSIGTPAWSRSDHRWTVTVRVTNQGEVPIGSNGRWPVNLGVHLLKPDGQLLENDYARSVLPMIARGESVTLHIELPNSRASGNVVEFDPVQENVAWFGGSGSRTLRVAIPPTPSHDVR